MDLCRMKYCLIAVVLLAAAAVAQEAKFTPTKSWEAGFTSGLFTKYCGSSADRPTCVCADGSSWQHPYYIAECVDGSGPTQCTCPNGADFPV